MSKFVFGFCCGTVATIAVSIAYLVATSERLRESLKTPQGFAQYLH